MLRHLLIIAALLVASGPGMQAQAAEPAPANPPAAGPPATLILVVDVKRVLDESRASVNVQKRIESRRSAFQSEIAEKEKSIRSEEEQLLQMRGKTEDADYAARENQLRQKFRDVERYVQERRQLLEQATTASMGRVRAALLGIVTDIAKKRGAHTVLVKQQVIWSEETLDITSEVLARLNAELPDVAVLIEPAAETTKESVKPPAKPQKSR